MKKFCTLAAVALAVAGLAHGQASAWTNIRLRAGVEFNWQAADNCYLWGLVRSGPAPYDTSIFTNPFGGAGYGGFGGGHGGYAPPVDYGHYYGHHTGQHVDPGTNGQPNGNGNGNGNSNGNGNGNGAASATSGRASYSSYGYSSYGYGTYQPVNYYPYYYYPSYYYGY